MKIIKIGALWCPACLIVNKHLKKIDNVDIVSYDYDFDEEIVKKYDVGKILPVLIFLDSLGNEKKRLIGEVSQKEIENAIKDVLYEVN